MDIKIYCEGELVPIASLKDHPKNRNNHPDDQIARLATLYGYHGIRHPIIVSKKSGYIVAGHGRKAAAELAGMDEFPVVYQDFENDDAEYAFLVADNAIALWSDLDLSGINADLGDLDGATFDIDWLGIKDFKLDIGEKDGVSEEYTNKIEIPIYEPTGPKPDIKDLYDMKKTKELLAKIEASNVSDGEKEFLSLAAYRHVVFNYRNVAEYYSSSEVEVQQQMENSALVIIDLNKAIEGGFVEMSKEISDIYAKDKGLEDDN